MLINLPVKRIKLVFPFWSLSQICRFSQMLKMPVVLEEAFETDN